MMMMMNVVAAGVYISREQYPPLSLQYDHLVLIVMMVHDAIVLVVEVAVAAVEVAVAVAAVAGHHYDNGRYRRC